MNIINSNINKLSSIKSQIDTPAKKEEEFASFGNNTTLPSLYPIGQSLVNKDLPVTYSKTGEISIPGLIDKASIYKLSNGQRVIIARKKGPAFIKTTYNVGSLNEPDNLRGISHFIEHNLFNGSKNLAPKEYDLKVSELGGDTNASTGFAATDYYLQIQLLNDNSLEEAIKLNAEQTQFPTFPNEQLIKEKEPVKSEIDMCNDDSNTVAVCKVLKNLFNIKSTSEDFVIGTKANINSFTRENVLDYFNTWYTPDNAVTVITGDVNPDETINLVSKYFNKQNDYSNIHKRKYEKLQYNDKPVREDIIKLNTTLPSVTMGFAIPEGTSSADLDKLSALFEILSSLNSNMYKELNKIGASFECTTEIMQNKPFGAKAAILTAYSPEEKIEDVIKIIYKELTKLANYPPSQADINTVKKNMIDNIYAETESSRSLNSILTNSALNNDYNSINNSIANIQNLTPYDISETAKKFLDLNKVSMCVSHDRYATNEQIQQNYQYSRNKNISFGAKISPLENIKEETEKIQQLRLTNNIESTIIQGNPNAKSCVLLDFNTDELNKTSFPALNILSKMLNRGSSLRGADNFNNALNNKNISLAFSVDNNGLAVLSESGGENLKDALMLIKETLKYPNFTQEEFETAKNIIKENIKTEKISPYNKLNQALHPELKKYEDKEVRLQELDKLTLQDINDLYYKILSTSQVQAIMNAPVDINPDYINMFNTEMVYDMPVFKPFSLEKNNGYHIYTPNKEEKIIKISREQAQADILQGYKFKESNNIDDIAKIEILNMILGAGGMSSRLFLDLRENKKLAYSVGSNLSKEKDTQVLCLRIGTTTESPDPKEGSPENIKKALEGFKRNVTLLKTQNVSDKELENAKTIYKTRILDMYETNMSKTIISDNANCSYYGKNYYEKLFEAVDKITPDDIKAAANYVFKNPPVTSIAASRRSLNAL